MHEQVIQEWLIIRERTIETLDSIMQRITEFNQHQVNVKKAQVAGGAAIGGAALVGILAIGLAPFTFGASAVIGLGAAALGGVGGVVAVGAGAVGKELKKEVTVDEAKQQYERDQMKLKRGIELAQKAQQYVNNIIRKCENIDVKLAGQFFAVTIGVAYRGTNKGLGGPEVTSRGSFTVGAVSFTLGGEAAIAGVAANKLLIPIDIAKIISEAINTKKDQRVNAIRKLEKLQKKLMSQRSMIEKALIM